MYILKILFSKEFILLFLILLVNKIFSYYDLISTVYLFRNIHPAKYAHSIQYSEHNHNIFRIYR